MILEDLGAKAEGRTVNYDGAVLYCPDSLPVEPDGSSFWDQFRRGFLVSDGEAPGAYAPAGPLKQPPILPVLGRREVGGRRAGGVVMGAPQIGDGPPPQTTGRERILPVMR